MDKVIYRTERLDHLGIVAGICHEINLIGHIDHLVPAPKRRVSVGEAVQAMVLNALGFVGRPLYLTPEFFANKPVELLIRPGITAAMLNDDSLGRALDALWEAGLTQVFAHVATQALEHFGLPSRFVHVDTSSFHVHGVYEGHPEVSTYSESSRQVYSKTRLAATFQTGSKRIPFSPPGKLYAILTLFVMSRPLRQLMIMGGFDVQYSFVVILYSVALLSILQHPGRFAWVATRDNLLLFLAWLPVLSVIWSADRASTICNGVVLLGGTFFGIYLAMKYSLREQMQIFTWVFSIGAILSIAVALLLPSVGTHISGQVGAWSGVYDRKNGLGRYMAINAVLAVIGMRYYYGKKKWVPFVILIISVVLIILARSATPLVSLVVTLILMPLHKILYLHGGKRIIALIAIALVFAVATIIVMEDFDTVRDEFFTVLNRDPELNTMTVRIELWNMVLKKIRQRIILGYGFGDAWVKTGKRITLVWYGKVWVPDHAHNGYLEMLLQLGIIGFVSMMYHLVLNVRRGVILIQRGNIPEGLWVLSYLTLLSLYNITASIFLGQLTVPWTIYVAVTLSTIMRLRQVNVVPAEASAA